MAASAIVYLELDDEITTAIARLRALTAPDAVLVVPAGSRVATSRINFKLLAREAAERRLNIAAVSDEPQVRALAISAGLPAYDSVAGAEAALATLRAQETALLGRPPRTMPRDAVAARNGPAAPATAPATATGPLSAEPAGARGRQTRARIGIGPLLVMGLVVLLVGAVSYGALVFLPTATITVRPIPTRIQVPAFAVTADPTVAVVDAQAGVIPAQVLTVPIHVEGTFNATGLDSRDIRATGTVQFQSENTLNAVTLPAGTNLATASGEQFETTADVTVPAASFDTGPTKVDAPVRALKGGTRGNVPAGAIAVVPALFANQLITVTNRDATSGGKHVEDQVVTATDYATAIGALGDQLLPALQTTLAGPGVVPRGLVAYAETAELSAGQPDQAADSLVGVVEPSFTLALDTTADVTAVNESLLADVAAARVRAALRTGQRLLGDNVTATHDDGTVVGDTVRYEVRASGLGYSEINAQTIIDNIRGKSLAEARATLAGFGTAEIKVWPDFVDHLPDQPGRISVVIASPSSAPATPSPRPSAS